MIGKLTGLFEGTTPDGCALIDVGGVGYAVRTPLSVVKTLQRSRENMVSLFIHTAVREDAIDLYGFLLEEDLSFFKQLTSVSGIGPKTAIGILNLSDVDSLTKSIARGDTSSLIKVFGIGKKSAERIVVELKDKVKPLKKEKALPYELHDADVLEALITLGYRMEEARRALKALSREEEQPHSISERVSVALRILGTHDIP